MARDRHIAKLVLSALVGLTLFSAPAAAQYSAGYKFLQAVKDKDGDAVMEALREPGSTLVNSRDITSGDTALHIVVARRDVTWINFLIKEGANPNAANNKGITPLVLAAQLGFIDGVQALVDGGAKVDIANSTGETPLIAAILNRNIPMIRVLLKAGADPDRADSSGRSARDYALLEGENSALVTEIEKNEKPASEREGAATYGPSF